MTLHCGPHVSKAFIRKHVLVTYLREYKTPCCPFCRNEDKFAADLTRHDIRSRPFSPDDLSTLDGIRDILESTSDAMFVALNMQLPDIPDQEKAWLMIRVFLQKDPNKEIADDGSTVAHLLAERGGPNRLFVLFAQDGLDLSRPRHDGRTPKDVALLHGHAATAKQIQDRIDSQV